MDTFQPSIQIGLIDAQRACAVVHIGLSLRATTAG